MKVDIFVPIYINDYLGDTMDLNDRGHGIYFMLILQYWKTGKPLTGNLERLMTVARTQDKEMLKEILDNYFEFDNGYYCHKRIEEEIKKAESRRRSAQENGKKGGRPKNPQKTYRFSDGKPTNNPDNNQNIKLSETPKKPLSPSTFQHSNSSNSNKQNSEEIRVYDKEWGKLIEYWNGKGNLPIYKKNILQESNSGELLSWMQPFTYFEIEKAIDNYSELLNEVIARGKPFETFKGFMRTGIDRFWEGANPHERYKSKKTNQYNMEVECVPGFGK